MIITATGRTQVDVLQGRDDDGFNDGSLIFIAEEEVRVQDGAVTFTAWQKIEDVNRAKKLVKASMEDMEIDFSKARKIRGRTSWEVIGYRSFNTDYAGDSWAY
jgi:hypothetical protein